MMDCSGITQTTKSSTQNLWAERASVPNLVRLRTTILFIFSIVFETCRYTAMGCDTNDNQLAVIEWIFNRSQYVETKLFNTDHELKIPAWLSIYDEIPNCYNLHKYIFIVYFYLVAPEWILATFVVSTNLSLKKRSMYSPINDMLQFQRTLSR